MTLVAIVIIPLAFILIGVVVKGSQRYFKQQQDTSGTSTAMWKRCMPGITWCVLQRRGALGQEIHRNERRALGAAWKSQFLSGMMMPIMGFIGNLGFVAWPSLGLPGVRGSIQVGDIQAFIQYVRSFNQPLVQSARQPPSCNRRRLPPSAFLSSSLKRKSPPKTPLRSLPARSRGCRVQRHPFRL